MIRAETVADLHNQLRGLLNGDGQRAAPPAAAPTNIVVEAPKGAKSKPAVEAKPEPTPEPEVIAVEAEAAAPEPQADASADVDVSALTYEGDIKPAVLRVSVKHGRPGVEKLLADFKAGNAREVPESEWPNLLAAIDKLLEG